MYIIICEIDRQYRFDAWGRVLRVGVWGWPWGMGWGGRWEEGSGWGTHVHPWPVHVNVWQKPPQYCKVISLQLKLKKKKRNMIGWPMGSNNSTVVPEGGAIVLTWLGCCLSWTFERLGTLHSISSKQSGKDFTTWGVCSWFFNSVNHFGYAYGKFLLIISNWKDVREVDILKSESKASQPTQKLKWENILSSNWNHFRQWMVHQESSNIIWGWILIRPCICYIQLWKWL